MGTNSKCLSEYVINGTKQAWNSAIKFHIVPLTETRGINPQIPSLCDEIWDYINNNEPHKKDNILTYIDIPIHSFFINNKININIILSETFDSSFSLNRCVVNKNNKALDNVIINLGLNENFDKNEFCLALSHELMHVYNYWHIVKKPRTKKIISYYANLQRYANSEKKYKTTNKNIEKSVRRSLYYIFRDEINAEFQSLYDYVLRNKKINRHNYSEYIRKTRIYKILTFLKNIFNLLLNLAYQGKFVIGHIYSDYMKSNSLVEYNKNEIHSFKDYKNKLEYTINYIENKMYRVVYYALEQAERLDECRINNNEENGLSVFNDIKHKINLDELIDKSSKISVDDFVKELTEEYENLNKR